MININKAKNLQGATLVSFGTHKDAIVADSQIPAGRRIWGYKTTYATQATAKNQQAIKAGYRAEGDVEISEVKATQITVDHEGNVTSTKPRTLFVLTVAA